MNIKERLRVLAVDDSPHKENEKSTWLVGVVYRGKESFDGLKISTITVDGLDATEKIAELYFSFSRNDIRVVLLDGITYAGFNIVDLPALHEKIGLPIIAFVDHLPSKQRMLAALQKHFADWQERWRRIEAAGKLYPMRIGQAVRYFQCAGISPREAKLLLRKIILYGAIPEPLRVANLIARAIGEMQWSTKSCCQK
ncbi:MAG: DUF99 family protein [bacterium]|nr:DUF99 family protein [bacterium]